MPPTCDICCSTTSPTAGVALGRSWPLFVRSWPLWSSSWSLFGRSWPLLGRSWLLLGRSWVALGRSLAPLGRSRADLGTTRKSQSKIDVKNDRFGCPKALQNDSKIEPKSDQTSIKKTKRKKNRTKTHMRSSNPQKY